MSTFMPDGSALHHTKPPQPPHVIDRALLTDPSAFGERLRPTLECVREAVLMTGSEEARRSIEDVDPQLRALETAWVRRLLEGRPAATELAKPPYLVCQYGYVLVVLRHPLPCSDSSAGMRIWSDGIPLESYVPLKRVDPRNPPPEHPMLSRLTLRFERAEGVQAWFGEIPEWHEGNRTVAAEVFPRPSGFFNAMLISAEGSGRIVVQLSNGDEVPRRFSLLASGWCSMGADRGGMSGSRYYPFGGPPPVTLVHVPDPDLFALCAAMTWTPSLVDAAWLAARVERLALR